MTRLPRLAAPLAALVLATPAFAEGAADRLVAALQARGYTRVEITVGPSQVKVEASDSRIEDEVVVDRASREVLERESGRAEPGEDEGVEIKRSDRDFVDADDDDNRGAARRR